MSVSIVDAATRTAFAAAAFQQTQCEAVIAPWAGGNVTARVLGTGGALRQTVTLGPWTIAPTTPREVRHGARLAYTTVSTGDIQLIEYRTPGGALIFTASAGEGATAAAVDFTGPIRSLCGITLTGAVFTANAALPAEQPPLAPFTVTNDGIWTWFTMPEAVQVGNFIYLGTVSSDGRCRAHRINVNTQATETFDLSGVLEVDDHNNGSVLLLGDGRVAFFYGAHNDSDFKYRIFNGTGSFTSSGSWTAQASRGLGDGPYSYPKPFIFPGDTVAGRVWLFHRRWIDGSGATRTMAWRRTNTLTGTSDPWSAYTDVLLETGQRPYVVMFQDGNKLHCAMSSAQPNESTFLTISHCYAEMTAGSLVWKRSDGTTISGAPFAISDTTRCDDGGNLKRWVSDISVGPDGHPRVLWMRYPNNNGTAIEYWHSRWTGSAWVAHKITDDGAGLYAGEEFYHGGLRFKWGDVTRIFLSAPISGVRQVQEWSTANNGASWSQVRALTSGGTAANPLRARPIAVHNSDGRVNVLWWQGRYTSFVDYLTEVRAAG